MIYKIFSKKDSSFLLFCIFLMLSLSLGICARLGYSEMEEFRLPSLLPLQIAWIGIAFLISFFLLKLPPIPSIVLKFIYILCLLSILASLLPMLSGEPGTRHIKLGPIFLNIPEFCGFMALLIAPFVESKNILLSWLVLFLPSALALLANSLNAALSLSFAALGVWLVFFPQRRERSFYFGILGAAFIFINACLTATLFPVIDPKLTYTLENITLVAYDKATSANAHTEFVLTHITEKLGIFFTFCTFLLFSGILVSLVRFAMILKKNVNIQKLCTVLAITLFMQASLAMLVTLGILKTPPSSVVFPFLSYSGSFLVLSLAGIVVIVKEQERKESEF